MFMKFTWMQWKALFHFWETGMPVTKSKSTSVLVVLLNCKSLMTATKAILASNSAKRLPTQLHGPSPNGKYAKVYDKIVHCLDQTSLDQTSLDLASTLDYDG